MSSQEFVLNKIYNESCLDTMERMPDESVDFIVTSPPYGVGKEYDDFNDRFNEIKNLLDESVKKFRRILVDDGRLAINIPHAINDNNGNVKTIIPFFMEICNKSDFNLREWITWVKNIKNPTTSTAWGSWCSPSNPHLCNGNASESILVYNKNGWKKDSGSGENNLGRDEFIHWTNNTWLIKHEQNKKHHPAPFPLEIPYRLIKLYTYIGDTVYDPFMGSGTTAIASKKLDRRWIGSEISSGYIKTAKERIENCIPEDNLDTVTLENGDKKSANTNVKIDSLLSVNGIGEKTHEKIKQRRKFISLKDLEEMDGIGEKTLDRVRDKLIETWEDTSELDYEQVSEGDEVKIDSHTIDTVEDVYPKDNILKSEKNGYLLFDEIDEVRLND